MGGPVEAAEREVMNLDASWVHRCTSGVADDENVAFAKSFSAFIPCSLAVFQ